MLDLAKLAAASVAAGAIPVEVALPSNPLRELHIDGDYAAYYYSGSEDTSLQEAKVRLLTAFAKAKEWVGAGGRIVVHLTCGSSCKGKRYKIAKVQPYQSQRSGAKPKNWEGMRAFLLNNLADLTGYIVKVWTDREADDGCAVAAAYAWQKHNVLAGILSRDKDFRMITGLHLCWTTHTRTEVLPDTWAKIGKNGKLYGRKWFWMQMLMGDAADHIPGLPKVAGKGAGKWKGCGEGTAEKLLENVHCNAQAYFIVKGLYMTFYGKERWAIEMAEQAILLWMRNDGPASIHNWMQVIPGRGDDAFWEAAKLEMEARIV